MLRTPCSFGHAFVGKLFFRFVILGEREAHAAHHIGRLRELDVRVLDDLEPVAPRIEKIEERPFDKPRASGFRELDSAAAVVDDEADMPLLDVIDRAGGR